MESLNRYVAVFEYLSSLLRCPSDRLVPLTAGSRHAGAVASPACLVAMIWMSSKKIFGFWSLSEYCHILLVLLYIRMNIDDTTEITWN